jgi:hypothetical protein
MLGTTTRHFGYQQENGTLSLGRQQVHFVQEESIMDKVAAEELFAPANSGHFLNPAIS